jgi:hypothetical protein
MISAKLIKIEHISKNRPESESTVKVNDLYIGKFKDWPILDASFHFILSNEQFKRDFYTTQVVEIIDDRTFKTKNSIYKIITVEDERDQKIKLILE